MCARQRGVMLFELMLVAAVALLVAVWAGQAMSRRINDAAAQQAATWMLGVRHAVHAYLEHYGESLRSAVSTSDLHVYGYPDWRAPRLAELKTDGLLSDGFPEQVRPGGGVHVRVFRDGDCPGEHCRISALVYSERPFLTSSGLADEQMLAQWLMASRGLGGIVHPARSTQVYGATFQYANPPPGTPLLPPGTVVMAIRHDQLDAVPYLRVRDERDPEFQSDATIQGNVVAGGVVSAGQHLHLASSAQWRTECAVPGSVTRDQMRGLLVCVEGIWQTATRASGGFSMNSRYGCATPEGRSSANPVTGACSCPAGHVAVPISEGSGDSIERGVTRGFLCVG